MGGFFLKSIRTVTMFFLAAAIFFSCGCSGVKVQKQEQEQEQPQSLPPVLRQDEVLRPYHKVAEIEVRRDRYGSTSDLTPEDYNWAYVALEQEAARMGADAVILPEVKVELEKFIIFPTSRMTARGVAIKFD